MTAEKWIYFPIETKAREFDSRLLLSIFALQRGFKVVLGQHYNLSRYLRQLPRGVYFCKDLSFYKKELFENLNDLQFKVVSLDEEAIFSADDPARYVNERFSGDNLEIAEKIFCWGEFDYSAMFPKYRQYADKFEKTGNPRLDLWSPQVNGLFDEKVSQLKDKFGQFIFIPSNFAYRSHVSGADFRMKYFEINNIIKNESDRDKIVRFHDYMNRGFDHFLELIPRLAGEYKNLNFVIRNHPSEDPTIWKNMASQHDNVIVEFEGSITPYIMASECILHFGCTSGLEAYIMDKPSLIYCPEVNNEYDGTVSMLLSNVYRSYETLKNDIDNVLQKTFRRDVSSDEYYNSYFYNNNKVLSAETIIDTIDKCIDNNELVNAGEFEIIKKDILARKMKSKIKNYPLLLPLKVVYDFIINKGELKNSIRPSSLSGQQKWPGLNQNEIETKVSKLSEILDIKLKVNYTSLGDEIFILGSEC